MRPLFDHWERLFDHWERLFDHWDAAREAWQPGCELNKARTVAQKRGWLPKIDPTVDSSECDRPSRREDHAANIRRAESHYVTQGCCDENRSAIARARGQCSGGGGERGAPVDRGGQRQGCCALRKLPRVCRILPCARSTWYPASPR
jgi:hypothetical protein